MILDFYRKEEMHVCETLCALTIPEELTFWGLKDDFLQEYERRKAEERMKAENFGIRPVDRLRSVLWDLMLYPETSRAAQAFSFISIAFVYISTITFIAEAVLESDIILEKENIPDATINISEQAYNLQSLQWRLDATQLIDSISIAFFSFEYCFKLILCPRKLR